MNFDIRRLLALGLFATVVGCNGGDTTGDTDADTDVDTNTCTSGIKGTPVPANGATDVYFRSTFYIEFITDESTTAEFALADSTGAAVALGAITFSEDGRSAFFQAADALAPSASYTLTVKYSCDKEAPIAFTTSATGAEVASEDFLGKAYALDLATTTIIKPAGVNALLGSLLGQLEDAITIVPSVYDSEAATIKFFGGLIAADGTQDLCTPTIDFPVAASYAGNPYFEISAPDGIDLTVSGVTISLLELQLSGAFSPGAEDIVGVNLAGSVDTRSLGDILGDALGGATGDSAVCDLLGQFTAGAVSCEACPSGDGDFCLTLVAANGIAAGQDWEIVEVTPEQVDANPECAPPAP
jgi:hypothetical protein